MFFLTQAPVVWGNYRDISYQHYIICALQLTQEGDLWLEFINLLINRPLKQACTGRHLVNLLVLFHSIHCWQSIWCLYVSKVRVFYACAINQERLLFHFSGQKRIFSQFSFQWHWLIDTILTICIYRTNQILVLSKWSDWI